MNPRKEQNEATMFMDSTLYHIKWAAMEELREALKLKEINEELLDQLASSLRWLNALFFKVSDSTARNGENF